MEQKLEIADWSAFKEICLTRKGLNCQYTEGSDRYDIYGPDSANILWHTSILKTTPPSADQTDFETTYAPTFNGIIDQLDSDGARMSRVKVAPSGWSFQLHGVEFTTALLGSLVNIDRNGNDIGDIAMSFYDASGNQLSDQATVTASCVMSRIDFEPPYDYYIVGGMIRPPNSVTITNDVRLHVIAVPDIPESSGGSKMFIQNVNMKYSSGTGIEANGRAAKWLQYSATYHTNKLRFEFRHSAGVQVNLALFLEYFKQ